MSRASSELEYSNEKCKSSLEHKRGFCADLHAPRRPTCGDFRTILGNSGTDGEANDAVYRELLSGIAIAILVGRRGSVFGSRRKDWAGVVLDMASLFFRVGKKSLELTE